MSLLSVRASVGGLVLAAVTVSGCSSTTDGSSSSGGGPSTSGGSSSSGNVPPQTGSMIVACRTNVQEVETASEAFFAMNGQWAADMSALVDAGLLREVPKSQWYTITYRPGVGMGRARVSGELTVTHARCG